VGRGMNEDLDRIGIHKMYTCESRLLLQWRKISCGRSVFDSYAYAVCTHLEITSQSYCVNGIGYLHTAIPNNHHLHLYVCNKPRMLRHVSLPLLPFHCSPTSSHIERLLTRQCSCPLPLSKSCTIPSILPSHSQLNPLLHHML
jgi:hypothetical protein